MTRTFGGFIE